MAWPWKGKCRTVDSKLQCPDPNMFPRLAMATERPKRKLALVVAGGMDDEEPAKLDTHCNSGSGEVQPEQELDIDQQIQLQSLDVVMSSLPHKDRAGIVAGWGGLDFTSMTEDQQTVLAVATVTLVAGRLAALLADPLRSEQQKQLLVEEEVRYLAALDNALQVPEDERDLRGGQMVEKSKDLATRSEGSRLEIIRAGRQQLVALARDIATDR